MTRLRRGIPGRTDGNQSTELSSLNEISRKLNELRRISSALSGGTGGDASLAEQQVQTALLTDILNEPDYEIVQCIGRDSGGLIPVTIQGVRAFDTNNNPLSTGFTITNNDVRFSVPITPGFPDVFVTLSNDFSSVSLVEIFFDSTYISGASPFVGSPTFELVDVNTSTVLDTFTVPSAYNFNTLSQPVQFTYDNSSTNYQTLALRINRQFMGRIWAFENISLPNTASSIQNLLIKRIDKYEDNILVSTEYFELNGNPYTLVGTFIKDNNYETFQSLNVLLNRLTASVAKDSTLQQIDIILQNIDNNTKDLNNLISHNTNTSFILPSGSAPVTYTGFKEFTFTVLSGTIDVTIGAGQLLTYPLSSISSMILGQKITADDSDISGVLVDATSGDVLITIKS